MSHIFWSRFNYIILLFVMSVICPQYFAYGQVTQEQLERSQEDIISKEEQRRDDYLLDLQRKSPPKPQKDQIKKDLAQEKALEDKVLTFSAIELSGATLFKPSRLSKITKPYLNTKLSLKDIDQLIRELTNLYIDQGYTTSRIYLPEQNLRSGTLKIHILESNQGNLEILEDGKKRTGHNTAFPEGKGDVFNIRDYEQGLDQVNRLSSYDAKIDLKPGAQEGQSDVLILTDVRKPSLTSLRVESHNGGSRSTGIHQQTVAVTADDYLGFYESIGLRGRHDMGLNASGKKNRGLSGNIEIPYQYWSFRFVGDYYEYLQTIRTGYQPYYLTGQSHSYMGEIERILHRDSESKTGLAVSMTQKTAKNFINGVKIDNNSRKLTIGSARLFHTRRVLGGSVNASAQYDQGLRLLGAEKDRAAPEGMPKAQFKRVKSDVSYYRPFQIKDQRFSWQLSGHGMWSKDSLFSSEKQSIGGQHTVRGYWDQSLSGNVGGYVRNELAWQVPQVNKTLFQHVIKQPELYVGFDAGWIRDNSSSRDDSGHLRGMGAGLRARAEHFFGEIGYERAFSKPSLFVKPEQRVFLKFGVMF